MRVQLCTRSYGLLLSLCIGSPCHVRETLTISPATFEWATPPSSELSL